MSLFIFLTVVQAVVAAALVGVILMQRSEGGGLGIGGSPNGMMSARGAADLLTKATKWLAIAFVGLSILLAVIAVETTGGSEVTTTLERDTGSTTDPLADPLAGTAASGETGETGAGAASDAGSDKPAAQGATQGAEAKQNNSDDPLAGASE